MERKNLDYPLTVESAVQFSKELLTAVFVDTQGKEFMIDTDRGAGIGAKYGYYIKGDDVNYVSHVALMELLNGEVVNGVSLLKR